jgi:hypothetical protein
MSLAKEIRRWEFGIWNECELHSFCFYAEGVASQSPGFSASPSRDCFPSASTPKALHLKAQGSALRRTLGNGLNKCFYTESVGSF